MIHHKTQIMNPEIFKNRVICLPYRAHLEHSWILHFGLTLDRTMSCFSVWNESGETNGAGKVVPAVPFQKGRAGDESAPPLAMDSDPIERSRNNLGAT